MDSRTADDAPKAVLIAVISALALTTGATPFKPTVETEPTTKPQAYLIRDGQHQRWCAFSTLEAHDKFAKSLSAADGNEGGWIRIKDGRLASITVTQTSEDAYVEDRYLFTGDKIKGLKRTGHYVIAPVATYEYAPGPNGRIILTASGRAIVSLMKAHKQESYVTDWPAYSRLGEFPFRGLLDLSGPKAKIKEACVPEKT